jgi:cytochrome b
MAKDGEAPAGAPVQAHGVRARLWDGPTRMVHWALVILIAFAWWSYEAGKMQWHQWAGYGVLGLIVFRLFWGFVGSGTARFSSFVRGPGAVVAYVKTLPNRAHSDVPGHNPVGALSVLAILAAIIAQVVTGLFTVDIDGLESGPLSDRISFDTGRLFAKWHDWSFTAIQALVALHVAAVGFYHTYKRSNLVGPMITGSRHFSADPGLKFAPLWRAVLVALIAGGVTWWVMKGLRF